MGSQQHWNLTTMEESAPFSMENSLPDLDFHSFRTNSATGCLDALLPLLEADSSDGNLSQSDLLTSDDSFLTDDVLELFPESQDPRAKSYQLVTSVSHPECVLSGDSWISQEPVFSITDQSFTDCVGSFGYQGYFSSVERRNVGTNPSSPCEPPLQHFGQKFPSSNYSLVENNDISWQDHPTTHEIQKLVQDEEIPPAVLVSKSQGSTELLENLIDGVGDIHHRLKNRQGVCLKHVAGISMLTARPHEEVFECLLSVGLLQNELSREIAVSKMGCTSSCKPSNSNSSNVRRHSDRKRTPRKFLKPEQRLLPTRSPLSYINRQNAKEKHRVEAWHVPRLSPDVPQCAIRLCASMEDGSCIGSLSPSHILQNKSKPHDPERPFRCTLSCGLAFGTPSEFKRHMRYSRREHVWVCDLGPTVSSPAGPRCSICGSLDPATCHQTSTSSAAQMHKKRVPCNARKLDFGHGGRFFRREDKLREHFRACHPGLAVTPYLATARVRVREGCENRCGFCGVVFSSFEEWAGHVVGELETRRGLMEWQDPWVCPRGSDAAKS